jgi:hypothetical protein
MAEIINPLDIKQPLDINQILSNIDLVSSIEKLLVDSVSNQSPIVILSMNVPYVRDGETQDESIKSSIESFAERCSSIDNTVILSERFGNEEADYFSELGFNVKILDRLFLQDINVGRGENDDGMSFRLNDDGDMGSPIDRREFPWYSMIISEQGMVYLTPHKPKQSGEHYHRGLYLPNNEKTAQFLVDLTMKMKGLSDRDEIPNIGLEINKLLFEKCKLDLEKYDTNFICNDGIIMTQQDREEKIIAKYRKDGSEMLYHSEIKFPINE